MIVFSKPGFLIKIILGASLMDKKPDHIPKNGLNILSRNDASSNPKIRILKFLLDFLSENDASSITRNWIFCPKFTDRG